MTSQERTMLTKVGRIQSIKRKNNNKPNKIKSNKNIKSPNNPTAREQADKTKIKRKQVK